MKSIDMTLDEIRAATSNLNAAFAPSDGQRLIVHICNICRHEWMPPNNVITKCPKCNSFSIGVHREGDSTMVDFSKHATKDKPRFVVVGSKLIDFCKSTPEKMFDPLSLPKVDRACWQLASINRFNGSTRIDLPPYNVAQHSILVGAIVRGMLKRPDLELPALMHDFPEIVYGDIVTGIKNCIGMAMTGFFGQIDAVVMNHYLGRLGFKYPHAADVSECIGKADRWALLYEANSLLETGNRPVDNAELWGPWPAGMTPNDGGKIELWSREESAKRLLERIMFCVGEIKSSKKVVK